MAQTTSLKSVDLDFSLYSRYRALCEAIAVLRRDSVPLKILEVGGRGGYLRHFLPDEAITVLDLYESSEPEYVQGDGRALPFSNQEFDLVVSTDVLEHIPPTDRPRFLAEQMRVARQAVIIAAPFYTREIAVQEEQANTLYRLVASRANPWLAEHLAYGLPKEKEIEAWLKAEGRQFYKSCNQRLSLWSHLLVLDMLVASHYSPTVAQTYQELSRFYNQAVYPFDQGRPGYRTIYTIILDEKRVHLPPKDRPPAVPPTILARLYTLVFAVLGEIEKENQRLIRAKDTQIRSLGEREEDYQQALEAKDRLRQQARLEKIKNRHRQEEIESLKGQVAALSAYRKAVEKSLTGRIIGLGPKLSEYFRRLAYILPTLPLLARAGLQILRHKGVKELLRQTKAFGHWLANPRPIKAIPDINQQYRLWQESHSLTEGEITRLKRRGRLFRQKPKISIITPVYKAPLEILGQTVASVLSQIYPHWELCLVDDGSQSSQIASYLRTLAKDPRIKIKLIRHGGIVKATNAAITLATGSFVAFLDHDDMLTPDALYRVVEALNADPKADMVYSDEDKFSRPGEYEEPYFKPDWSPYLLLAQMFPAHLRVYRKSLGDRVGWMRRGFDGSQDYDFTLRLTEKTERIVRIPKILYHWRKTKGSTALNRAAKSYAERAALAALTDALKRRKITGRVERGLQAATFHVTFPITGKPKVSIVIPSRDQGETLRRCIRSIKAKTTYSHYEIIILDNQSTEPAAKKYLAALAQNRQVEVIPYPHPFNFSAINNFGARRAQGQILLFLNNDTEVINGDWLKKMIELAQRPDIGAVGAKLLYPDGTIQHAGVILGIGLVAGHSHKYIPDSFPGYFALKDVVREYSAVTAACLMIEKRKFNEVKGFDENFVVALNDVDLCLRLGARGYKNIYTPYARLYHHESTSVGRVDQGQRDQHTLMKEVVMMQRRWGKRLLADHYYNPNLSQTTEDFGLNI